jgi:SAM-dependent methyltransferase
MTQHWTVREDSLEINLMPFYWRLTQDGIPNHEIAPRMPIRVYCNKELDMLEYHPSREEAVILDTAYRQDANIGFLNEESGQLETYGTSVNRFFLDVVNANRPRNIYEIGCGAGQSIRFLKENGWNVTGIDPSDYSRQWSERLGFTLLNTYFTGEETNRKADLIYCNDVFEHVTNVVNFAAQVCRSLVPGGVFCFATTNSSRSINLGDISMLEHQHVNMFTERSIRLILARAGFGKIEIRSGSYGDTFQVIAIKNGQTEVDLPFASCPGFFSRAEQTLKTFGDFYKEYSDECQFYVPLRCIPYLASVGDYGTKNIFDSNTSWRGKFIDGYGLPIRSIDDIPEPKGCCFFVGSLTFFDDIRRTLFSRGYSDGKIYSIMGLLGKNTK